MSETDKHIRVFLQYQNLLNNKVTRYIGFFDWYLDLLVTEASTASFIPIATTNVNALIIPQMAHNRYICNSDHLSVIYYLSVSCLVIGRLQNGCPRAKKVAVGFREAIVEIEAGSL